VGVARNSGGFDLNTYTVEFFAFCPVNNVRIKYELLISTCEVIKAEDIIDEVTLHSRGFHEDIADQLLKVFGGQQWLKAEHHGVHIETHRSTDQG
jgi:hypothetical protein